jgi:putative component of membrane protein insertase Oxa1/YidC/SpoIIIJ protein YidD
MKADADAGDDCEFVPPSSRYRRKTLKHGVAGGKRCAGTRALRISNPKSS